jgi:hypothetical protein
VDGNALSPSIGSLFTDFFPNGRFEASVNQPQTTTFHDDHTDLDSIELDGELLGDFLGTPQPKFHAWFFVANDGNAEVAIRFSELPDLSRSFPTLADAPAFSKCVLKLDSRRIDKLGDDFDRLFSRGSNVKRGLNLEATLNVAKIDDTLADVGLVDTSLAVKGPVDLDGGAPRMWLTTTQDRPLDPLGIDTVRLSLGYQYLTAPVNGSRKTKERLGYKLFCGSGPDAVVVPLAITFEPNMLSEKIVIESDWKPDSSPLSLKTLLGLLPADVSQGLNALIPKASDSTPDITSKFGLGLADLRLELSTDPMFLSSLHAGIELNLDWSILKGPDNKDLIKLGKLRLNLNVSHFEDDWEVSPYLTGTVMLFDGYLSGGIDLSTGNFCCVLDDDRDKDHPNKVNLKKLITQSLCLPEATFPFEEFSLSRFEIWGDLSGGSYGFDIATTFSWDMPSLGNQRVTIRDLYLKLEYDEVLTPAMGGSLELWGMTLSASASYEEQDGWTFGIAVYSIHLTDILVSILGENGKPTGLPDVTFSGLDLVITPKTGAFQFSGSAQVSWERFFNTDASFRCTVGLTLERPAPNGAASAPVTAYVHFNGQGLVPINGGELAAEIDVTANASSNAPLTLAINGSLSIPMGDGKKLSFAFTFATDKDETQISASWPDPKRPNDVALHFGKLASALGADLSGVPDDLIPKLTGLSFTYNFTKQALLLTAKFGNNQLALRTAQPDKGKDRWYAFGFQSPEIATGDMGVLGSAFQGYGIALQGLLIAAANSEKLTLPLGGAEQSIPEGLLLKGTLAFKGTTFSYPFECNLGGTEKKPVAPDGVRAGGGGSAKQENKQEANNNAKIGRKIGPITFRKARFEYRNQLVYVLLDASLSAGGFELDLEGFNLNFPLAGLTDPKQLGSIRPGLEGLSLAYSNPPLMIAGGFSRIMAEDPYIDYLYQGHLLIKAEAFQVSVMGSYGTIQVDGKRDAALFLYGMYAGVIGGPPPFYVTGLALGGGYNTRLMLPPIEEVAQFPLVQAAAPGATLDKDKLRNVVKASYGDYWLALGLKFTSFKIADSFALFTVAFGNRLQFALLGVTTFTVPPSAPKNQSAMYAELAIRAVLDPDAGIFSFEGRLTQNSYLFTADIRLVGGFAFFVWFGNSSHAGDFVISLGGYHPEFEPPSHYPVVPRIGINGKVANVLTVTGEAYVALTPSCLMAGLKVGAVFENDYVVAAFVAYADFLIAWAPFHYDARIGIGIAVVLRFMRSFKLEISAELHIWGPPFAGTARVTLWVVSFSIEFGDQSAKKPAPLTWPQFREAFLPPRSGVADHALLSTIRIRDGMVREVKKGDATYRIVNPHELTIETESAAPCSKVQVGQNKFEVDASKIGIRPMAAKSLSSIHTVTLKKGDSSLEDKFRPQWSTKSFPEALWSPKEASGEPSADMMDDLPSGVVLRVQPASPEHSLGPFAIGRFEYEPIDRKIPWALPQAPVPANLPSVITLRTYLGTASGPDQKRWNEINLSNTENHWVELFQAPPKSAALV